MNMLTKDPSATLDYAIDWGLKYLQSGEFITASQWRIEPPGELLISSENLNGAIAHVDLEGGVKNAIYMVTNHIDTSLGRTDERSITLRVQDQ